jgi:hypothetical protein
MSRSIASLLPSNPGYAEQASKVVHVPEKNEITNEERDNVPLRFYAKRAKLMAAFQKFAYQKNELDYTNNVHLKEAATHFANILLRYDFWKSCEVWFPIGHTYQGLEKLLRDGTPGIQHTAEDVAHRSAQEGTAWTDERGDEAYTLMELPALQEIRTLWHQLANLGRMSEEICREWFLPTYLGVTSSY